MGNIAVITARGNSKRIPKKNIKDFCGKPIIAYSILSAIRSNLFDKVMVSTDDEEIKAISEKYGAEVPFMRSDKNSDDNATTADVLLEVIETYLKTGHLFEYLCCIYPTAPFITVEKLQKSMKLLMDTGCDSVIPIVQFSFPPQRGFLMQNDYVIKFQNPEYETTRSQDLQTIYHDCGQYYCINIGRFIEEKSLIMKNTKGIITDESEVQDIDNYSDWEIAEMKYKIMMKK